MAGQSRVESGMAVGFPRAVFEDGGSVWGEVVGAVEEGFGALA